MTQVGIGILWLAIVGFTRQFFLNMEIERYTLATGETAVAGFTRFWKPWGIIFILGAILPNLFPRWVTSSATAITYTFGINEDLYRYIAVGLLVTIGLIVSLSPVVYRLVDRHSLVGDSKLCRGRSEGSQRWMSHPQRLVGTRQCRDYAA